MGDCEKGHCEDGCANLFPSPRPPAVLWGIYPEAELLDQMAILFDFSEEGLLSRQWPTAPSWPLCHVRQRSLSCFSVAAIQRVPSLLIPGPCSFLEPFLVLPKAAFCGSHPATPLAHRIRASEPEGAPPAHGAHHGVQRAAARCCAQTCREGAASRAPRRKPNPCLPRLARTQAWPVSQLCQLRSEFCWRPLRKCCLPNKKSIR